MTERNLIIPEFHEAYAKMISLDGIINYFNTIYDLRKNNKEKNEIDNEDFQKVLDMNLKSMKTNY